MTPNKIILTDYPKLEGIPANPRGMETERLKEIREETESAMMGYYSEIAGGYEIVLTIEAIDHELEFRGCKPE